MNLIRCGNLLFDADLVIAVTDSNHAEYPSYVTLRDPGGGDAMTYLCTLAHDVVIEAVHDDASNVDPRYISLARQFEAEVHRASEENFENGSSTEVAIYITPFETVPVKWHIITDGATP